jgi:hypothetical protein
MMATMMTTYVTHYYERHQMIISSLHRFTDTFSLVCLTTIKISACSKRNKLKINVVRIRKNTQSFDLNDNLFYFFSYRIKTQLEKYIQQLHPYSTFPYITFIHGGFFYQNFVTFFVLGSTNLEFRYPLLAHARIPFYDVHDTGKVVRECFRHPEKWGDRQTVPIVAEQVTMEEICTTIREVTGKDVHFVPLSYDAALLKLHRETVNNLRWHNDIGRIDERRAEKTKEICPQMKTFPDWLQEIQWLME